jgi:hypothetical protein
MSKMGSEFVPLDRLLQRNSKTGTMAARHYPRIQMLKKQRLVEECGPSAKEHPGTWSRKHADRQTVFWMA